MWGAHFRWTVVQNINIIVFITALENQAQNRGEMSRP
jgi:hypothetical protein